LELDSLTPDQAAEFHRQWHDHERWCRETIQIRDKQGITVPVALTPAQVKLTEAIYQQESEEKPVRIVVLKARQIHMSVGCSTHMFKRVAFSAGQQGMVFGDTYKAAKNIFGYLDQFDQSYLPYLGKVLKPETLSRVAPSMTTPGRLKWDRDNWIETNTARNVAAGRSYSIRHLHLSEYGFYQDAAALMTGLLQCVPDDEGTTIIVESTANGVGGPFYELWNRATDPGRQTDWLAVFFAWWEHPEYSRPLEVGVGSFENSLTREEQDLRRAHRLTLEQLNWRRWAIENKCEGSTDRFHQEYPSTPEEAFLTSGRPRFDMVSLGRMPIIRDPLAGELEVVTVGTRPQVQFLPREDGKGALQVWKRPREGGLYVIGADSAEGIDANEQLGGAADPDFSSAQVLDQDTGEQVAHLRARLEPSPFGQYLVDLGRWYNWAFLIPESNSSGLALIEELLRQQWPIGLLYQRQRMADDRRAPTLQQLGFRTTTVTKPQLISVLDRGIRDASVVVRDALTLQELRTFVYKAKGKQEAQDGCHDDTVIALALATLGLSAAPRDRRMRTDRPEPRFADVPTRYGGGGRQAPERQFTRLRRL
jgi:hypothetical protein